MVEDIIAYITKTIDNIESIPILVIPLFVFVISPASSANIITGNIYHFRYVFIVFPNKFLPSLNVFLNNSPKLAYGWSAARK